MEPATVSRSIPAAAEGVVPPGRISKGKNYIMLTSGNLSSQLRLTNNLFM